MTPEQLFALIESYGAEPARWPPDRRAEAEDLVRRGDPAVVRALDDARALDAALSSDRIRAVDADLVGRIVASGPRLPWWRRSRRSASWWLYGVGLVGAGVGGVVTGALAISLIVPAGASAVRGADEASVGTAFGDVRMEGADQ